MITKSFVNKKPLVSSSEHFLRIDIKRYEEQGWQVSGKIIQSLDGRYSCLMTREHTVKVG